MARQEPVANYTLSIRNLMQAELESINQYERHMQQSDIPELNEIWQYIVENEKGHYGMLLELLRRFDPQQAAQYENVRNLNIIMPSKIQTEAAVVKRGNLETLNYIRNDIRLELATANAYEIFLLQVPLSPILQVVNTISQDEKEHIELLTKVLIELDTDRYGPLT